MLLIAEGLLIVQQEIEASILIPADLINKPIFIKNKMEPSMKLTKGEPSERKETLQISVAMAEPIIVPNININLGPLYRSNGTHPRKHKTHKFCL